MPLNHLKMKIAFYIMLGTFDMLDFRFTMELLYSLVDNTQKATKMSRVDRDDPTVKIVVIISNRVSSCGFCNFCNNMHV